MEYNQLEKADETDKAMEDEYHAKQKIQFQKNVNGLYGKENEDPDELKFGEKLLVYTKHSNL